MAFGHRAQINDPLRPAHVVLAVLIVALGVGLRVQGAQGDLWQDEIWSLNHAATMSAWHEVFWNVIHDNNHPFNTLYLYLAGPGREPWVYRLASIVAGALSIVAAGWAVARGGGGRMLIAMLLTAVLYPLVHFGSEARGYALMILFAYIAFGAVDRAQSPTGPARWVFGLMVTLGALSHFSILPIAFMMSVAFGLKRLKDGHGFWSSVHATMRFSAPAAGGLALIGAGVIYGLNHLTRGWYGGGAAYCPDEGCFIGALDSIVRFTTGGFGAGMPGLHSGLFVILVIGAVSWLLLEHRSRAVLYATLFIGTPLLYLALGQPNVPFGRYFIAMIAFLPLLLADLAGELRGRARSGRVFAGVAILALVSANAWAVTRFHQNGRGNYGEVYDLITENNPGHTISVGSDHTFRFSMVFDHLAQTRQLDKQMLYSQPKNVKREHPDWLVLVMRSAGAAKKMVCLGGEDTDSSPVLYGWIGSSEYWGLAGANWDVYHRLPLTPESCSTVPGAPS
ncbi:hypothetical protein [Magnetovibrio sp.]|uniref:hypothetical protein n=1 Tax=Magnetovibrio sp. TaxID=2024836 RepID=UPI002F94900E